MEGQIRPVVNGAAPILLHINFGMSTKLVRTLLPIITSMILLPAAQAKRNAQRNFLCSASIATTSTYYTPSAKVICNSNKPCGAFKEIVDIQGSGTLSKGKIYTFTGKTVDIGECETSLGKGNTCLIPYISVAADLNYHELGDIIEVPALKGKEIRLENGKIMKHPGYFIVDDRGAASHIRGPNRFDVYTGSHDQNDPKNAFGSDASSDLRMVDKKECGPSKAFNTVKTGSAKYKQSQQAINQSLHGAGEEPVFAVNSPSSKTPYSESLGVR